MRASEESIRVFNESGLILGWLVTHVPPHGLSASLVVRGTFELLPGSPARLLDDQPQLSGDVPDPEAAGAIRYALDLVPVKRFVDIVLTGSARTPGGRPTTVLPITFGVGRWSKTLFVVGDREVKQGLHGGSISDPVPFQTMPLTWGRSFGGQKIEMNRGGRGRDEIRAKNGKTSVLLPNILRQEELTLDPQALHEPASFGPIPQDWPQRMDKARRATYDDRWLEERWPAPPSDFDWSFFNAAPADQQLPIKAIRGDEPISLKNLLDGEPEFAGQLPGIRPRWFFKMDRAEGIAFIEAGLNIDTIWVDSDARQLVILWRGVVPVRTKSLRDILELLVVQEPLASSPPSIAFYEQRLEALKAEKAQDLEVPPLPGIQPLVLPPLTFDWEKWEADLLQEKAAIEKLLADQAMDPAAPNPKDVAAQLLRAQGADSATLKAAPPKFPAGTGAEIAAAYAKLTEDPAGTSAPPPAEELDLDAIAKDLADEINAEAAAPLPGTEDGPEEPDEEEEPKWTRERVAEAAAAGQAVIEQDLAGLDLSELDLSGAGLAGCVLEGANLSNCRLVGTDFTAASLAGADLSGADVTRALFKEADLTGANLTDANLEGSDLSAAMATGASFKGARFPGARAHQAAFGGCDMGGASLTGGDFRSADFTKADWTGATLNGASLESAGAYGVKAAGANFEGANLANFRASEGADLRDANFKAVNAPGSIWTGSRLDRANFTDALLDEANFSEGSLVGTIFITAELRRARFSEADLENVVARRANMFRARFEDARLVDADFRGASLYEAEFLDADIRGTNFQLANLKGTKLV